VETVTELVQLRERVARWRHSGERIAFVPTMGNLHAGHFHLVTEARRRAQRVIASVFVNPTQFGPNEDFARYPRTPEADAAGLERHGCDLLFLPAVPTMYPDGLLRAVRVEVPEIGAILDGAARPGHFAGVATVVTRLFNMVQPDLALFGRKDFQQLRVIERLVRDLAFALEIVGIDTVREANGLALSSRNQYLAPEERERAAIIFKTLNTMAEQVRSGVAVAAIESEAESRLRTAGLVPDYATVRRALDLAQPEPGERQGLIALIAARLGNTRLIDNVLIE
jgi:pantoate--beta-alanine ligase